MRNLGWMMIPKQVSRDSNGFLLVMLTLLLIALFSIYTGFSRPSRPNQTKNIFVQIEGDVRYPGVYGFLHPPVLRDLFTCAGSDLGSLKPFAAKKPLCSGIKVVVHRNENSVSVSEEKIGAFCKITLGIPLSINEESWEGLTAIRGIGPVLARNIVFEREKRGGFTRLDEIVNVQGIGPRLYRKIRPNLKL